MMIIIAKWLRELRVVDDDDDDDDDPDDDDDDVNLSTRTKFNHIRGIILER